MVEPKPEIWVSVPQRYEGQASYTNSATLFLTFGPNCSGAGVWNLNTGSTALVQSFFLHIRSTLGLVQQSSQYLLTTSACLTFTLGISFHETWNPVSVTSDIVTPVGVGATVPDRAWISAGGLRTAATLKIYSWPGVRPYMVVDCFEAGTVACCTIFVWSELSLTWKTITMLDAHRRIKSTVGLTLFTKEGSVIF